MSERRFGYYGILMFIKSGWLRVRMIWGNWCELKFGPVERVSVPALQCASRFNQLCKATRMSYTVSEGKKVTLERKSWSRQVKVLLD